MAESIAAGQDARPPHLKTRALLRMRGIDKSFPGVHALRDVDLELRRGEVLALLGENGAGKSTLIKVLGGAHPPDAGSIQIDGQDVEISSPVDARRDQPAVGAVHTGYGAPLSDRHLNINAVPLYRERTVTGPEVRHRPFAFRARRRPLLEKSGFPRQPVAFRPPPLRPVVPGGQWSIHDGYHAKRKQ